MSPPAERAERIMKLRLGLTLLVGLVVLLACGTKDQPVNVLVIGVDTLRPDHLGCYGYGRDTSPTVDRIAADGVLFENAISQSPWTLPSFSSLFTSLYPSQHGALSAASRMRESFPTLGTILKEHGYATGAVVNATVLRPEYGVNRGFDYYDPSPPEGRRADGATAAVLKWIDQHRDRPFMMFAHYFDPHEPYAPLAPYDTLFDTGYSGRIGNAFVLHDYFPGVVGMNFDDLRSASEDDWDHIRALYDGEIAFTDKAIGDLLDGLSDLGVLDNTLVIFLSDHGEEFYEHEGFGHGHTLFGEVIRVPMIFSFPGHLPRGVRIPRQVRSIDVMPTVLDLLDIQTDTRLEGVSLLPVLTGTGDARPSPGALFPPGVAYSEGLLQGTERKGVTAHPWKLVYDLRTSDEMLFNLKQDPAEIDNLIGKEPDALALIEDMMFRSLFEMTDTWYLEIAGTGEYHTFDIRITSERGPGIGNIHLFKLLDPSGRIVETGPVTRSPERHLLELADLRVADSRTLAFKVEAPRGVPVNFNLRIDGEPAVERTYFGPDLESPTGMPFPLKPRRNTVESRTGPSSRPQPPYFLIWHCKAAYGGETRAELDEKTRNELRALGYIQ